MPVRLDTKEARQKAMNGKNFQIKIVPTLHVGYRNGEMQLFVGQEKVMQWLQQAAAPSREEEYDMPVPSDGTRRHPPKKKKKPRGTPVAGDGLYSGKKKKKRRPPVEFTDSEEESSENEEDEVEIEFVEGDEEEDLQPPPTQGLMVGAMASKNSGKKSGSSVMALAKQMAQDRTDTLGYDEGKIPRSS